MKREMENWRKHLLKEIKIIKESDFSSSDYAKTFTNPKSIGGGAAKTAFTTLYNLGMEAFDVESPQKRLLNYFIQNGMSTADAEALSEQVSGLTTKLIIEPSLKQQVWFKFVKEAIKGVTDDFIEASLPAGLTKALPGSLALISIGQDLYKIEKAWIAYQNVAQESNVEKIQGIKYLRTIENAFQSYFQGIDGNTIKLGENRCIDPWRSRIGGKTVYKYFDFYQKSPQEIINWLWKDDTNICIKGQVVELEPLSYARTNVIRRNLTNNIDKLQQSMTDLASLLVNAEIPNSDEYPESHFPNTFKFLKKYIPSHYQGIKSFINTRMDPVTNQKYLEGIYTKFKENFVQPSLAELTKVTNQCHFKIHFATRDASEYQNPVEPQQQLNFTSRSGTRYSVTPDAESQGGHVINGRSVRDVRQVEPGKWLGVAYEGEKKPYDNNKLLRLRECVAANFDSELRKKIQGSSQRLSAFVQKDNQNTKQIMSALGIELGEQNKNNNSDWAFGGEFSRPPSRASQESYNNQIASGLKYTPEKNNQSRNAIPVDREYDFSDEPEQIRADAPKIARNKNRNIAKR